MLHIFLINLIGFEESGQACVLSGDIVQWYMMCATLYMQYLLRFNACFPHGFPLKQLGGFEDQLYAKMPQAIFTRLQSITSQNVHPGRRTPHAPPQSRPQHYGPSLEEHQETLGAGWIDRVGRVKR